LAERARLDMKAFPQPAANAGAGVLTWSTDTVDARERFSYWREVVCQAVFNISIEAPRERFSARMRARSSGPIRLAMSESAGDYQIARSAREIASAPADHYSIYLQVGGQSVIEQRDESIAFQPNDIAISDGRQPFRAAFSDGGHRAIALVPHAMINRLAPWLQESPIRKLASDSPYVDLARRHLLALTSGESMLSESATSLLTDNLCNLLALASAREVAPSRLQPELMLEALLAFCRQNLHEPELSPRLVAARFGISVRTLHLRFEKLGQSFGRWLLENRLDACGKALRDPHRQSSSISEIAYRWGFNDLSHFNKAFRARFGMSPSEMRAEFAARQN
jgi:AraC-like DNA-binding protein